MDILKTEDGESLWAALNIGNRRVIDPFEAIATVGCKSDIATSTGHDIVGGCIFLALMLLGTWIASRSQDTDSEYDILLVLNLTIAIKL